MQASALVNEGLMLVDYLKRGGVLGSVTLNEDPAMSAVQTAKPGWPWMMP